MKGVCLVAADAPGGIRRYVRTLAEGLAARHPERPVVVLDSRGRWAWSSPLVCLFVGLRLIGLAAVGRVATIHLMASERMSLWRKGALAGLASSLGLNVIVHHHGARLPERARHGGRMERLALRLVARMAHRHLVLGEAWRDALVAAGAAPERIEVLPNALPDRPAPERPLVVGAPLKLLFLGEISRRKGVFTVLETLEDLTRRGVPFEALLVGDGPDRQAVLHRLEAREPGALRIAAPGRASEGATEGLMGWADMLLHPSTHEGLPMALLEALRSGLPSLASPVGAIAEWMPDGDGVEYVPPEDATALTEAVLRHAADPARRRALGLAARHAFEARFTLQRHLDRMIALYDWERPDENAFATARHAA
ncbi:MAG: glycosyltransferase family 4 protein [Paracoccaceae bacterium]